MQSSLNSDLSRLDVVSTEVTLAVNQLNAVEVELERKESDISFTIRNSFFQIRAAVDAREEALMSSLSSKRFAVTSHKHHLESFLTYIQTSTQSYTNVLHSTDISQCSLSRDSMVALLSRLNDVTKSTDWREVKYDNHMNLACDSDRMIQSINQLGLLDVSNEILKAKRFYECRPIIEQAIAEMKQQLTEICTDMEKSVSNSEESDIDARLSSIASNHLNRLNGLQANFNIPDDWFNELVKTLHLEWDVFVSQKKSNLNRTADETTLQMKRNRIELESRMIIVDILKQTRGELNWNRPDDKGSEFNWSEELPLGEWDGIAPDLSEKRIQVDENGMITRLFLSNLRMRGALPYSIGTLINLTILDIGENQLIHMPDSFGNLKALTVLCVDRNQLTQLPDTLGNLTALKKLWLGRNQLNRLPDSIGNLDSLSELDISYNKLSSLPGSLGNLTNLTHLDIRQLQTSAYSSYFSWKPVEGRRLNIIR